MDSHAYKTIKLYNGNNLYIAQPPGNRPSKECYCKSEKRLIRLQFSVCISIRSEMKFGVLSFATFFRRRSRREYFTRRRESEELVRSLASVAEGAKSERILLV